jgi:hypothetical protein
MESISAAFLDEDKEKLPCTVLKVTSLAVNGVSMPELAIRSVPASTGHLAAGPPSWWQGVCCSCIIVVVNFDSEEKSDLIG